MSTAVTGTLSKRTIHTIFDALKVAISTKCEDLLIDDFGVSGRAIETNIVIIQPMDEGTFEFQALGLSRIPDLYARMKLVIDDDSLTGTYTEFRDGIVGKLEFKTKRTRFSFKCKSAAMIKTNKKLKDAVAYSFDLNADAIKFMNSGTAAMKNKSVQFKLVDGEVLIRLFDTEGDSLEHVVTDKVKVHEEDGTGEFSHTYDIPKLAPLLNAHKENTTVNITTRGIMNLSSDGFNIYLVADL